MASLSLERFIDKSPEHPCDLLVVGGGITGCCLAYEAASRGLSVLLVEKGDFGGATSSATSKLIHGGLRYLKNLEFGLVRESLRERRIWENIAPNFVHPLPFVVPSYDREKTARLMLGLGMNLYEWLSYDKQDTWDPEKSLPGFRMVDLEHALRLAPGLRPERLEGAAIYYDCQNSNPERMTLAFLKSAVKLGAKAANRAELVELVREDGRLREALVRDSLGGGLHRIRFRAVANCAGPWVDAVARMSSPGQVGPVAHPKRSEGIHLITRPLSGDHAIAMATPQGRHIMVLPWRGHSLIGTTDKPFEGQPDDYRVSRASIQELLDEINQNFGHQALAYGDVLAAYGGLRPLVDQEGDSYNASRRYEILDGRTHGAPGMLTVEGGKFTTSRQLAANALDRLAELLGEDLGESYTDKKFLATSHIPDMATFREGLARAFPWAAAQTLSLLANDYGTQAYELLALPKENPRWAEPLGPHGEIEAQVVFALRHEQALTLEDLLLRRTGLAALGHPGRAVLERVAELAADWLGWSAQEVQRQVDEADSRLRLP